jgi:hypothetical protein
LISVCGFVWDHFSFGHISRGDVGVYEERKSIYGDTRWRAISEEGFDVRENITVDLIKGDCCKIALFKLTCEEKSVS